MTDYPEVSVITCTNKLGGVDLIRGSVMNQDFDLEKVELILVDDFYHLRRREVQEYFEEVPFAFRYLPPAAERTFNLASSFNRALMLAEGELIVPLEDYEWASSDWLSAHYNVWKEKGPGVSMHGVTHNCRFPRSKFGSHIQDVRKVLLPKSRLKHALISVFPQNKFNPDKLEVEEYDTRWPDRFGVKSGEMIPSGSTHIYRNVSLPLERALELNGYDEGFDGDDPVHFEIDPTAEFFFRAEAQGHRFIYTERGSLFHLNHWDLFSWDRKADYSYMRMKLACMAKGIMPTVAQNDGRHMKVLREARWRTSRARFLLHGRLKDNCRFSLDDEGDSDAAITALVYRKARAYLNGVKGWVLDDGCGSGEGLEGIESRAVGIDISPIALREARERGVQVVLGDVRRLPFRNGAFGAVLSIETMEHLVEGESYLDEIRRVLRKRGRVAISTPDGGPVIGSHVRLYTRRELVHMVQERFRPVHLEIVDWRSDIGREDKLFLRAVRE